MTLFWTPLLAAAAAFGQVSVVTETRLVACSHEVKPGYRVVLLGLRPEGGAHAGSGLPSAGQLKERGYDCSLAGEERIEPRYLVMVTPSGPQRVQAFELKGKGKSGAVPDLLDTAKLARSAVLSRATRDVASFVAFLNPFEGASATGTLFGLIGDRGERQRKDQADYLSTVLESYFLQDSTTAPVLDRAFGSSGSEARGNIEKLYAELVKRYNRYPELNTIMDRKLSTAEEIADRVRDKKLDAASEEFGQDHGKIALPNELSLLKISPYHALLVLHCGSAVPDRYFARKQTGQSVTPSKEERRWKEYCKDGNDDIPLGIFGLERDKTFLKLIDFEHPNHRRTKALVESFRQLATAGASAALPPFAPAFSWGSELYQYEIKRSGSDRFENSRPSYQALRAAAEVGLVQVNDPGILRELLLKQLGGLGALPEERKGSIREGLGSRDPVRFKEAVSDLISGLALKQSGVRAIGGGEAAERKLAANRSANWQRFASGVGADPRGDAFLAGLAERERKASESARAQAASAEAKQQESDGKYEARLKSRPGSCPGFDSKQGSYIVLKIDGLAPDVLREAIKDPRLKYLPAIVSRGVQLNSYDAVSTVSMAAWTNIETGMKDLPVVGASNASRDPQALKHLLNMIDFRTRTSDKMGIRQRKGGPLLNDRLKEVGYQTVPERVGYEHVAQNQHMLDQGKNYPFLGYGPSGIEMLRQLEAGALDQGFVTDMSSAHQIARDIEKDPCRYSYIDFWMMSHDHLGHTEPAAVESGESLLTVDAAIGTVLRAARLSPNFDRATIVLVSDHGLSGAERWDQSPLRDFVPADYQPSPGAGYVTNTMVPLAYFWEGRLPGPSRDYHEVVGSHVPIERVFNSGVLTLAQRSVLRPFHFTGKPIVNQGDKSSYPNHWSMVVDTYGNKQGAAWILRDPGADPARRMSYHDLVNFRPRGASKPHDMISELLDFRVKETALKNEPALDAALDKLNGKHPVGLVTLALQGDVALRSASAFAGGDGEDRSRQREPVLVRGLEGRTSLILSRDMPRKAKVIEDGKEIEVERLVTEYRYVVFKAGTFRQDADGALHGEMARDIADDPLGYDGGQGRGFDPSEWKDAKAWLALTEKSRYPGGISFFATGPTLSPYLSGSAKVRSEKPDLFCWANYGFHFDPWEGHSKDHGGADPDQVRTTTLFRCPEGTAPSGNVSDPVFTTDFAPTMLQFMNRYREAAGLQGDGLKDRILGMCRPVAPCPGEAAARPGR